MSKGYSAQNSQSVQRAVRRLQRWEQKIGWVPKQEVARAAQQMYPEIIAQVPYDTGALERSVSVKARGLNIYAKASAKSESGEDYAGIQHDNTTFHHPVKGKAYYIKDPFNHQVTLMQRRIRRKLRKLNGR